MNRDVTRHLRVFEPHPGLFAYYDGRVPGHRFMAAPNWVDNGAIELGIATYALVSGASALVYDTHVSPAHGAAIRAHLEGLGVRHFTVIYSHWHLDHVAGTGAFADCRVIANTRTATHLATRRTAIEAGTESGPPVINPLILPTETFGDAMSLDFEGQRVDLIHVNIHSDDATVLWLPDRGILLAGDTVEDCVTYVGEPEDFSTHLADLDKLFALGPKYVLPDHGSPTIIEAGGYSAQIIPANQRYIRWLMDLKDTPQQAKTDLNEVIALELAAGTLEFFEPYNAIHAQNIDRSLQYFNHG
jgi:cyclase